MPNAISASTPRSATSLFSPISGTSHVSVSAKPTASPARTSGRALARNGCGSRVRASSTRKSAARPTARRPSAIAAATSSPVVASRSATTTSTSACTVTTPTAIERCRATTAISPRPTSIQTQAAAHVCLQQQRDDPEQRDARAGGEHPRHEQDPHLRDERLGQREPGAEREQHERQCGELPPDARRVRQEDLRREHEHEPVPGGGGPLQEREVAAAVLEQRPLVDHRQLEVRVRVVDRLAARLGDDDGGERDRGERERRRRPGARAGRARDHADQVGRARNERRDREREDQADLDEDRDA